MARTLPDGTVVAEKRSGSFVTQVVLSRPPAEPACPTPPPAKLATPKPTPVAERAANSDELRARLLAAIKGASASAEAIRQAEATIREGAAGPYTSADVRSLLKLRLMGEGQS